MKFKILTLVISFTITNIGLSNDDDKVKPDYYDSLAGTGSKTTTEETKKTKKSSDIKKEDSGDFNYWITKSSGKRHNKSCRYFKSSNGYGTNNSSEGKVCGVCGS
ncbi:MAG: hypothetical protein N2510_08430 [Ignavibacteria bacterium]|nr:hypothetical protein [Ignavibacteria bacterium]